jgi:hypothetical protein
MNIIRVHGILGFRSKFGVDYFRGVVEHLREKGLKVLPPATAKTAKMERTSQPPVPAGLVFLKQPRYSFCFIGISLLSPVSQTTDWLRAVGSIGNVRPRYAACRSR